MIDEREARFSLHVLRAKKETRDSRFFLRFFSSSFSLLPPLFSPQHASFRFAAHSPFTVLEEKNPSVSFPKVTTSEPPAPCLVISFLGVVCSFVVVLKSESVPCTFVVVISLDWEPETLISSQFPSSLSAAIPQGGGRNLRSPSAENLRLS